jgi:hypothetical protein
MATVQRQLVHKQFNSPIALYSDRNIKETLDRELKILQPGVVGINFDDPSTTRPGMLAKSAVLAALEEEERNKRGQQTGLKRVAWPPPPESSYIAEPVEQEVTQPVQQQQQYQSPTQQPQQPQYYYQAAPQEQPAQQVKSVLTPARPNNLIKTAPVASYNKPVPPSPKSPQRPAPLQTFHSTPSTNFNNISPQPQPQQIQTPLSAGVVSKPLSPLTHLNTSQPPFNSISTSYSPSIASTATFSSKSPLGWAHVDPPVNASYQQNKYYQTNSPLPPPFELTTTSQQSPGTLFGQQQPTVYQAQPVQTFRPVVAPVPYQGTPLRKEAPIHQKPAPVFPSQPAAAKLQGGVNMRGDQKWPPAEYKAQSEQENEERRKIAQGPAFRPKRVNKDYSQFFAKNALNSTYPGYRAPPGTQHHG